MKKEIKRYAIHDAGHVLGVYFTMGNIDRIESANIDELGGYVDLNNEFITQFVKPDITTDAGWQELFFDACYTISGGVAVMLIYNEPNLDWESMSEDRKQFEARWKKEIDNKQIDVDDLFTKAKEYCMNKFKNNNPLLTAISTALLNNFALYQRSGKLYRKALEEILNNTITI